MKRAVTEVLVVLLTLTRHVVAGAMVLVSSLSANAATVATKAALPPESVQQQTMTIQGLQKPARIIIDHWGIAHIFAANVHDAFFLQGFNLFVRFFQNLNFRVETRNGFIEISACGSLN